MIYAMIAFAILLAFIYIINGEDDSNITDSTVETKKTGQHIRNKKWEDK